MTWLYTFAFIKLMCCNFINTLTLNRLSISPVCCVYYHYHASEQPLNNSNSENTRVIMSIPNCWVHFRTYHTYIFSFTQARSFNLNAKVIYRAPILSEKHQRVELILLLSLKAGIFIKYLEAMILKRHWYDLIFFLLSKFHV